MELGGVVTINCEKTGYHAELEFKLKVFRFVHCLFEVVMLLVSCSALVAKVWEFEVKVCMRKSVVYFLDGVIYEYSVKCLIFVFGLSL